MSKYLKSLLFLMLPFAAFSQENYTISGYMRDGSTGEELLYATVVVKETGSGATTNLYGFYSITLPAGKYTVQYSYIGMQAQEMVVDLKADLKKDVELTSGATDLNEIVIEGEKDDENITNTEVSVVTLDVKDAKLIPVLLGEQDILKTLQLMPGVSSNSEGSSGFFVRGGDADQNLILLDEAPVYNASHLLGFFSVFNSDALKDVKLYKGGMPAEYGGRVSSVMDVRMKNGNMKEWNVSGGLGLISSRLTVEGPIQKDKGSIIVSGRRTYADVLAKPFLEDGFSDADLYFYDFNLKANYKIGEKDRIYLSGYLGRDVFGTDNFGFNWGNTTGTLRWNHLFSDKLFSNTTLVYSDYDYGFKVQAGNNGISLSSGIYDYNLKQDYNYYLNPNNTLSFGWLVNYHRLKPSTFTIGEEEAEEDETQDEQKALEGGFYISNEQKFSDKLTINYGVRLSTFSNVGEYTEKVYNEFDDVISSTTYGSGEIYNSYYGLEPRVNATYLLNNSSSLKASYNRNYQYLHLLSNSTSGTPTDLWIASSPLVKPQIANQVALGYFRNFNNNTYEFSAETYYKNLENQVDFEDGGSGVNNLDLESDIVFGKGRTYGLEVFLKKKKGDFTGWISYTLAKSERQFEAINDGSWFSARQDRTHDISIVGVYQLSPKWSLSASFVYYTGDAVTFPIGKYFIDGGLVNLYGDRNADRMPNYHRLDLGATYIVKDNDKFYSDLSFSIYNIYNQRNAYQINFSLDDTGATQATQLALFGIIPSITWNFNF
ncbi:MAG: TonB-dependent receptor [Saprospiraceae bacterium]